MDERRLFLLYCCCRCCLLMLVFSRPLQNFFFFFSFSFVIFNFSTPRRRRRRKERLTLPLLAAAAVVSQKWRALKPKACPLKSTVCLHFHCCLHLLLPTRACWRVPLKIAPLQRHCHEWGLRGGCWVPGSGEVWQSGRQDERRMRRRWRDDGSAESQRGDQEWHDEWKS